MTKRSSGLLMHISSLPSKWGVGDLGPQAFAFADFLKNCGLTYWQVLPLTPTDGVYGNSPYASISAFAGNFLFISPDVLANQWNVDLNKFSSPPQSLSVENVDYGKVSEYKEKLFSEIFDSIKDKVNADQDFQKFCTENADWLDQYVFFKVLKLKYARDQWNQWPENLRKRDPEALKSVAQEYQYEIQKIKFYQFVFYYQWRLLKDYCTEKGIHLVGDIPIYVTFDSADVWGNPDIFKLDQEGNPIFVAGVPPDYFSKTGQRWGNPVYDWEKVKQQNYTWWLSRLRQNSKLFDTIRIDHFRGFAGYWEIPASEETAINGHWTPGPQDDFFNVVREQLPELSIIAEDLGLITDDVGELMQRFDFPGMKVLLFAFCGDLTTHPYIPENYVENCVVYTGTHDNNTVQGWYANDATDEEKKNLSEYLKRQVNGKDLHWVLIDMAFQSKANLAIVPLQDFLGLGQKTRMNLPGTLNNNWQWRVQKAELTKKLSAKIQKQLQATGRI